MSSRYGTLDVSLSATKNDRQRLNRTLQVASERDEQQSNKPDNDEKVNKFKQLYNKNEKLRKQLKVLNQKLNEKLQKLKLPSVRKKALSVDLNNSPANPPSKALVRQLENAYKQIAMYKKQVQVLKGKQDSAENYDKLRNTENMITYTDMEINKVQEQLKSINNVKKMQEKVIHQDVENEQLTQRTNDYLREIKSFRNKMKELDKKSRKREEEFKKQQAYLVALKQKIRKFKAEELELEKPSPEKEKEASEQEFRQVKQQIKHQKQQYEEALKKLQTMRKQMKNIKQSKTLNEEAFKQKETLHKQLLIQVETFTRLLKDLELKKYEQTGVRPEQLKPLESSSRFLKLQEIQDDGESKISQLKQTTKMQQAPPSLLQTSQIGASKEWKGKMRKVSMGYTTPTDTMFQQSGNLLGLTVFQDENKYICGIAPILLQNQARVQSKVQGIASGAVLRWQVQPNDAVNRITGSFTEQGYLASLALASLYGQSYNFGSPEKDVFNFDLSQGEFFSGVFGGLRRLGQDVRITEIGFWISRA